MVNFITKKLQNNDHEVYFVGGSVRDKLLGRIPKDIDLVTSARPDEIIELFGNQNVNLVGKSFGVCIINDIEITTYRTDNYEGYDDKKVEVVFANSLREDLKRRDLTINSIAQCPITGIMIDPFGGIKDIENRLIKFVGHPVHRIVEDPNRIIRACRFKAVLDGEFDDATFKDLQAATSQGFISDHVAPERIRAEIIKAMSVPKASVFFNALYDIGALKYIFPTMLKSVGLDGGHWHAEDVWDHMMMCGDSISTKFPLLKLAGYLHDIGKPSAAIFKEENNSLSFPKHQLIGSDILRNELQELKFSNDEISYISDMTQLHMRFMEENTSPRAIRRTLADINKIDIPYQDLVRIRIADKNANLGMESYKLSEVKDLINKILNEINRKNMAHKYQDLAINGLDIIEILHLKPGREIGEVLKHIFDLVIDDPTINTKEQLVKILKSEEVKEVIMVTKQS